MIGRAAWNWAARRGKIGVETLVVLVVLFVGVVVGVVLITPGPAAHSDAKRQARPRPARLRRHAAVPAAAGQSGRRHADHLRQQLAAVPACSSSSWLAQQFRSATGLAHRWTTRSSAAESYIYNVLYIVLIYFFCYFWTAITFNPEGHGRQPEELRHLHPRLSARASARPTTWKR